MFSVIYTPTEGEAIQNYSRLFRKPEGCFLNIKDQDRIEENLAQFERTEDVDYIVVSDGEEVTVASQVIQIMLTINRRSWALEIRVSGPFSSRSPS